MKRFLFVVAAFLTLAVAPRVWATASIVLSPDTDGSSCSFQDISGVVLVHVVVLDVQDLSAIQFAAPQPACWQGAAYLSEQWSSELVIGDSQDPVGGVSIAWGQCLDGPVFVGTITYFSNGQANLCCDYPIVKASGDLYPEIDAPIIAVCGNPIYVAGIAVDVTINPADQCPCLGPVATKSTTWGLVKAMYRGSE